MALVGLTDIFRDFSNDDAWRRNHITAFRAAH
jgi:hypothetical protein